MSTLHSICVYCGSSPGVRPAYAEAARRIGMELAREQIRLVYGGGNVGLMGTVARSTIEHGGKVTGIIPKFLQRRERMLAEATLPTMRYEVPIQPRVATPRTSAPRFASEVEPAAPVMETQETASVEASAPAELLPVKASVFDDDFFRMPLHGSAPDTVPLPQRFRETTHHSAPARVQSEETWGAAMEMPVAAPEAAHATSFGGAIAAPVDHAEPDELDIPAFLRRGN